jgi:DNA-binding protein HU-beta
MIHPKGDPKMARKPMTKAQSVSYFAKKFELSKRNAAAIFDEVASLAISETKKTGSFTLPGIGKLVLLKKKARMGRNPATGEAIKILAKTVVKMRIAKAAKEAIVPQYKIIKKKGFYWWVDLRTGKKYPYASMETAKKEVCNRKCLPFAACQVRGSSGCSIVNDELNRQSALISKFTAKRWEKSTQKKDIKRTLIDI